MSRRIERRALLGVGGGLVASHFLGGEADHGSSSDVDLPKKRPELLINVENFSRKTESGAIISFNNEGLPYKCVLPQGETIYFYHDEVLGIKNNAVRSKEPQIFKMLKVPPGSVAYHTPFDGLVPNPDGYAHPRTLELPGDVIPQGELENRGIKIIQAKTTQLYIREKALSEGALLGAFNNSGRKLIIALLDTPIVSDQGVKDEKYSEVRHRLTDYDKHEDFIRQYKRNSMSVARDQLVASRKHSETIGVNNMASQETRATLENMFLIAKEKEALFRIMDNKDVLAYMASQALFIPSVVGRYAEPTGTEPAVIFVAAGPTRPSFDALSLYFSSDGEFKIHEMNGWEIANGIKLTSPDKHYTHPSPDQFVFNEFASSVNPRSYPYGGQTIGQTLRHEIMHDKLMTQQGLPNNEYLTDMAAMRTIGDAWKKWVDSDYRDNSGYYFVFTLPDGDYILSRGKVTQTQAAVNS